MVLNIYKSAEWAVMSPSPLSWPCSILIKLIKGFGRFIGQWWCRPFSCCSCLGSPSNSHKAWAERKSTSWGMHALLKCCFYSIVKEGVCARMRTNMAVFPSRNQVLEMFDHAYQNYMVRAKFICQLNIDILPHGRETTMSEKTAPGNERVHAGKMNRSSPFSVLLKKCLDN